MIQKIDFKDTLELRKKVLRPNGRLEDCFFPGDQFESALHLGAFADDKIIGVATFYFEISKDLIETKLPYRLRGMAVDEEFQRHGVGRRILKYGEDELQDRGCDLLWFNAREKAFAFYLSMGFQLKGELFEISGIGPHKVMYKTYARR